MEIITAVVQPALYQALPPAVRQGLGLKEGDYITYRITPEMHKVELNIDAGQTEDQNLWQLSAQTLSEEWNSEADIAAFDDLKPKFKVTF